MTPESPWAILSLSLFILALLPFIVAATRDRR